MNTGGALEPGFLESFSLLGKSALHFPDAEKHDEAKFWRTSVLGKSVLISRPADTNFYACSSRRRIRLQADAIINRFVKTLLAPEVSLRRLN
jgi:hypothetical protein